MPKTRKNKLTKGGANVSGLTTKGGAAIAEGKWGCIFSPPYPCAVPNQPVF